MFYLACDLFCWGLGWDDDDDGDDDDDDDDDTQTEDYAATFG